MLLMIIKMVTQRLMINIKKDKLACKILNSKPCVGEAKYFYFSNQLKCWKKLKY
jgi:hypothetical protein